MERTGWALLVLLGCGCAQQHGEGDLDARALTDAPFVFEDTATEDAPALDTGMAPHSGHRTILHGGPEEILGRSVATTADGSRVIVGSGTGPAHVFVGSDDVWQEEATLGGPFASAVAISPEGSVAVVGSPNGGSVRVYLRLPGDVWSDGVDLISPRHASADEFGFSVAVSTDGTRIIAGSPGRSAGGVRSGAADVFVREGDGWRYEESLVLDTGAEGDAFGAAVDVSNDGSRAVVSAPARDTVGPDSGAAWVFVREADSWRREAWLHPTGWNQWHGALGSSVAISGDGLLIALGAPYDDREVNSGRVFVFERREPIWDEGCVLDNPGTTAGYFGMALAVTTGGERILVGAPGTNFGDVLTPSTAYAFERRSEACVLSEALVPPVHALDFFGGAAALADAPPYAFIAAEGTNWAESLPDGAVHVFVLAP